MIRNLKLEKLAWRKLLSRRQQQRQLCNEDIGLKSEESDTREKAQGLFGNFLLQTPECFKLLNRAVESRSFQLVNEIVTDAEARAASTSKRRTTVELLDDLSNEICAAADLTDCVRCCHTDPDYLKAAEESMREFTYLVETLNTTPELYYTLKKSLETEKDRLDPISLRTAKLLLEDFENSGVQLDEPARQQFVKLSDEIFDAGSRFVNGCEKLVRLSPEEQEQLGAKGVKLNGPWIHDSDYRRRTFTYARYFEHDPDQESSLKRLIAARHQIAQLTGFPTFAERAQKNSILCTYGGVQRFLKNTIKEFSSQIDPELEQISRITRDNSQFFDPNMNRIGLCDLEFAALIKRQQLMDEFGLDRSTISHFFTLGNVLEGFHWLSGQLYGLHFRQSSPTAGECWPGNVLKLDVHKRTKGGDDEKTGQTTQFLGTIFVDVDQRPTKLQGDCHFTVRCSKLLESGEFQTPIVVLSLSIIPPHFYLENEPASMETIAQAPMSIQQANNFFHEMGHAMHSILGRTKFQHVAGTRCPTDFAEVPSHLMECFFNDSRILRKIFRDKSGRALDEDQVQAIIRSRHIFNGVQTTQQAIYALFDLELHGECASDFADGRLTSTEFFGQIHRQALPQLAIEPNYAYHHRISHLVSYGAKYYSYLVARASAELIYARLFQADPCSQQNGQRWAEVQSHGGEYASDVLLANALGTPETPTPEQLTSVLVGRR